MIKPEPKMSMDTNMGGPLVNPFAQAQPLAKETMKATKIKLNQPKPFTGKWEDLKSFFKT